MTYAEIERGLSGLSGMSADAAHDRPSARRHPYRRRPAANTPARRRRPVLGTRPHDND